jgi:hypothetical protein
MYEIYAQFNGSIECSIAQKSGWENITNVAKLRKKRRKCDQARRQILQDIDSLIWQKEQEEERERRKVERQLRAEQYQLAAAQRGAGEDIGGDVDGGDVDALRESLCQSVVSDEAGGGQQLGYRADMGSLAELEAKAAAVGTEINELTVACLDIATSRSYTPTLTRSRLTNFLDMYVYAGELLFPSMFHSMAGVHLAPVGHPAFQVLLNVRHSIARSSKNCVTGSVIFHDGDVIWTDIDDSLVQNISTFVRIQEYSYIRNSFRWSFAMKGDKLSSSQATAPAPSTEKTADAAAAATADADADADIDADADTEGDGTATEGTADHEQRLSSGHDDDEDDEDEDDGEEVEGFFDEHGSASHEDTSEPGVVPAAEFTAVSASPGSVVTVTNIAVDTASPSTHPQSPVGVGVGVDAASHDTLSDTTSPKSGTGKSFQQKIRDRVQKLMRKGKGSDLDEASAARKAKAQQEMEEVSIINSLLLLPCLHIEAVV